MWPEKKESSNFSAPNWIVLDFLVLSFAKLSLISLQHYSTVGTPPPPQLEKHGLKTADSTPPQLPIGGFVWFAGWRCSGVVPDLPSTRTRASNPKFAIPSLSKGSQHPLAQARPNHHAGLPTPPPRNQRTPVLRTARELGSPTSPSSRRCSTSILKSDQIKSRTAN